MIVNPANDIYRQAHQGSVSAIIQVLNDKLADSGVRTRAIFAHGVLQLLCEAATPEQLDRTHLTERVRKVLESISPRNIRRVNINSRIVREQQLLWLEEIHRDPDGQLLWAQEITLKRPNIIKRVFEDVQLRASGKGDLPRSMSPQSVREKRQFTRGVLGGLGISTALLLVGWGVYTWQNGPLLNNFFNSEKSQSANAASAQPKRQLRLEPDPFASAVRLAERAAESGKTARTPEEYRELADMWGKASELMSSVQQSDERYPIAQDRTNLYRSNKELLLEKAK